MRFLFPVLLVAALAMCSPQQPASEQQTGWQLVWSDEFDGIALDETKWSHRYLGPRESAMIARECVSLDGQGHLVMTVFEKDGVLQNPMIGTQGKFEALYGRFAARIRFPEQQGQHGSFWMQPAVKSTAVDNPALTGAEIDIIEWFGAGRRRWRHRLQPLLARPLRAKGAPRRRHQALRPPTSKRQGLG